MSLRLTGIILTAALAAAVPAQTALRGELRGSHHVVTNEQDLVALAALAGTNALLYVAITNEAALRASGDAATLAALYGTNTVLYTALTNEAALRASADLAGLAALYATNTVLYAALTNEAAIRAAADTALAAFNATNRVTRLTNSNNTQWVDGDLLVWQASTSYVCNVVMDYMGVADGPEFPDVPNTPFPLPASYLADLWYGGFVQPAESFGVPVGYPYIYYDMIDALWAPEESWDGTYPVTLLPTTAAGEGSIIISHLPDTNTATLATAEALAAKLDATAGTATNLNLVSDWQIVSNATGSVTITNLADRPIQYTGTGAVTLAFSGLQSPAPVYLLLGGFSSVTWPTNAYAVGGWGAWQTNRLNHFAVWEVGSELYVNQITTSEE